MKKQLRIFGMLLTALLLLLCTSSTYAKAAQTLQKQVVKVQNLPVLKLGESRQLKVESKTKCQYTSSNPKIVSVSASGVVTAQKYGNATIRIKAVKSDKYYERTTKLLVQVRRKTVNVYGYSADGKLQKTYSAGIGEPFQIPSLADSKTKTFVGWSLKPKAALKDVKYYPGQKIVVRRAVNLYAVYSQNSNLKTDVTLPQLSNKYQKIILVGDSRFHQMNCALKEKKYFNASNIHRVKVVAKGGEGLKWFQKTAMKQILDLLPTSGRPIAIVLALGVNQLDDPDDYYTVYTQFAKMVRAKNKNCRLFVVSINPYNDVVIRETGGNTRNESRLYERNSVFRRLKDYTYIDTLTYLRQTGYAYDSIDESKVRCADGLHFSRATQYKVFTYIMNFVNSKI